MKTKSEMAEYRKNWNANNKEKKSKSAKRYYEKNKEKIKAYSKKYRQDNSEKVLILDRDRNKLYYENNKSKILKKLRQNYKDRPQFFRNKYYHQNYKITLEKYNEIFDSQKGNCAICGIHQSLLPRNLAVDHNHKTAAVRGLLCFNCNQGLGRFQDNVDNLKNAIHYLSKM